MRKSKMQNATSEKKSGQLNSILIFLVIVLLYGGAVTLAYVNTGDKVYDFTYNQMTERLNQIEYRPGSDDYRITGDNAFFQLYVEDPEAEWHYWCLKVIGISEVKCKLVYLDQDRNPMTTQEIVLYEGDNTVNLENKSFEILRIEIQEAVDTVFSIQNMHLRELKNNFWNTKNLAVFIGITCLTGVGLLVARRILLCRKMKNLQQIVNQNINSLLVALGRCVPKQITYRAKRFLRGLIFGVILGYVAYVEGQGTSYMVSYYLLHIWIVSGLLLILAMLCWERTVQPEYAQLATAILVFLIFACASDFELNKKFRYAAFCMLVFGGIFCRCWHTMKQKEHVIEEFKYAVKAFFIIALLYCIIFRPAYPGICYSGYLSDCKMYGINMLFAMIVFLSDISIAKWGFLNGIGVCTSVYLVWLTQQPLIIIAAIVVLVAYMVFWLYSWIKSERKMINIIRTLIAVALGMAAVFLLRKLIYSIAPMMGTSIVYENDKPEEISMTIIECFRTYNWKYFCMTKWLICKEYIRQFNMLGHSYLTEFHGKAKWADSRIIMNTFRYGVLAGVSYGLLLIGYISKAIKYTVKKKEFLALGITLGGIFCGMAASVETPFAQTGWLVFYLGICWMLAVGDEDNEIFEYECR